MDPAGHRWCAAAILTDSGYDPSGTRPAWAGSDTALSFQTMTRIRLRATREVPKRCPAGGYGVLMASPSAPLPAANPVPPEADPVAIRACLSPRLVAEFDAEWDIVLEQASSRAAVSPVCAAQGGRHDPVGFS